MNDEAARYGRPANSARFEDTTRDRATLRTFTPPRLAIMLPLEGAPYVRVHCDGKGDEARIRAWIETRPELRELVDRALRLGEEKRAG